MFGIELRHLIIAAEVAFLDSLLSVDNALVLAVLVEHLPPQQRTRALRYGILGAYLFRGLSLFLISLVIENAWVRAIGALYLLWLGVSHLWGSKAEDQSDQAKPLSKRSGFWMTVVHVELTDLVFSLDNIVATVALAPDDIPMVVFGVFISIIAIRYVAGIFLRMLAIFPILRSTAYLIVTFLGAKLLYESSFLEEIVPIHVNEYVTFGVILAIIMLSLLYERIQKSQAAQRIPQAEISAPARDKSK